jgi:uncharacterized Zn finger protein (UPF0148 family)
MQNVSCPSCGAPVQFRSHASVLAVCDYCQTTVLKEADAVKDLGKMSALLEDYSPLQIGTSGVHGGRSFSIIGRIQLRYAAGMWNEWYLLFDDGSAAWLGDSSGMYTLTTEKTDPATASEAATLPRFTALQVAHTYPINGVNYLAAEIRNAECIGGQGELPFRVGAGWRAPVADFRNGSEFLTLDYSDGEAPRVYRGTAVTLEQLECQLLRDDDAVKTSAGKYKGKVDALACPSCGSSIKYLPGVTAHLVCPSCQSQLDAAGPATQVLAAGERVAAAATTLELGAQAKIDGVQHQIIGLMRRADDENTEWTEYLLYNTRGGFIWLIETDEGWARAKVASKWPLWQDDCATLGPTTFRKLYAYPARVTFAAGAFNWRVQAGDVVQVIEFGQGQNKLAAEMTEQELTWSQSSPVAADQIRAWFGAQVKADKSGAGGAGAVSANKFIFWLLALNAGPLLMAFGRTWLIVLLAVLALYLPAKYLESISKDAP